MTLVSFAHDFIYLRTSKTASTSTEMYLQPFCTAPDRSVTERNPNPIISSYGIVGHRRVSQPIGLLNWPAALLHRVRGTDVWRPHMQASEVKGLLDPAFWGRATKITSVRNPFTRLVSSFYWGRRAEQAIDDRDELIEAFRATVRNGDFTVNRDVVMIDDVFVPEILIRQEHLAADLENAAGRLGLDISRTHLPMTKKTRASDPESRPSIREFYDDETTDIVRRRFAWVFDHAGYSQELPDDDRQPLQHPRLES